MPWKEVSPMEEIIRFVMLAQSARFTVSELCEQFGISRKTGYKPLLSKLAFFHNRISRFCWDFRVYFSSLKNRLSLAGWIPFAFEFPNVFNGSDEKCNLSRQAVLDSSVTCLKRGQSNVPLLSKIAFFHNRI